MSFPRFSGFWLMVPLAFLSACGPQNTDRTPLDWRLVLDAATSGAPIAVAASSATLQPSLSSSPMASPAAATNSHHPLAVTPSPTASPTPSPTPTPTPNHGWEDVSTRTPPPSAPTLTLVPADGGFSDPSATETVEVGP